VVKGEIICIWVFIWILVLAFFIIEILERFKTFLDLFIDVWLAWLKG